MRDKLKNELYKLYGEKARLEGFREELKRYKGGEFINALYFRCAGMIEGMELSIQKIEKVLETDEQGDLFDE